MALERKQKLIHLHTSESNIADVIVSVELGEIVVKHNSTTPELYIKKTDGTAATFIDKVAIETLIEAATTALTNTINGVAQNVTALSGSVETHIENVAAKFEDYYTSAQTDSKIEAAKKSATDASSAYTDAQIEVLDEKLAGLINGVDDKVTALTQTVADNKAAVDTKFNDYYTSAETDTKIAAAMKSATDASSAYTDAKVQAATTALTDTINGVAQDVDDLSGSVESFQTTVAETYATKTGVTADIATAKSEAIGEASAYTDTKVQAATTALTENINGVKSKVDTLIGVDSGKTARSIAVEEVTKIVSGAPEAFDTLKEIADWIGTASGTSAATLVADIEALKDADKGFASGLTATNSNVTELSGVVKTHIENVATKFEDYYTSAETDTNIATAKDAAIASAGSYTDAQIEIVNSAITSIDSRLQDVEDLNSTVLDAILDIEVTGFGDAITATVEDHKATLDLSSITIDCGTF